MNLRRKATRALCSVAVVAAVAAAGSIVAATSAGASSTAVQAAPAAVVTSSDSVVRDMPDEAPAAVNTALNLDFVEAAAFGASLNFHVMAVPEAVAPETVKVGPGYELKAVPGFPGTKEHAGAYINHGVMMICLKYKGKLYYVQATSLAGVIPGLSVAVSRQVFYVINRYLGAHPSNTTAAAVWAAARLLSGDPAFVHDWSTTYAGELNKVDPRAVTLAHQFIAEAPRLAGPYALATPVANAKVLPGQVGTFNTRVTSATGYGLPGAAIRWSVSRNAAIVNVSGATNSAGNAGMIYKVTNTGPVTACVVATVPDWSGVVSHAPAGFQTLVGVHYTTLTKCTTYSVTVGGPKISYSCIKGCTGIATVTTCFHNAAGYIFRLVVAQVGGHWLLNANVAAGKTQCWQFKAADRAVLVSSGQYYLGGGHWSPWINFPGKTVIDCPPWLTISYNTQTLTSESGSCDCYGSVKRTGSATRIFTVSTGVNVGKASDSVTITGLGTFVVLPGHSFTKTVTSAKPGVVTVTTTLGKIVGSEAGNSLAFTVR